MVPKRRPQVAGRLGAVLTAAVLTKQIGEMTQTKTADYAVVHLVVRTWIRISARPLEGCLAWWLARSEGGRAPSTLRVPVPPTAHRPGSQPLHCSAGLTQRATVHGASHCYPYRLACRRIICAPAAAAWRTSCSAFAFTWVRSSINMGYMT